MAQLQSFAGPVGAAEGVQRRRSDRICAVVPIEVRGTDVEGLSFIEETKTTQLGRFGATIVLRHTLSLQDTVAIRHFASGNTAECRVVGDLGEHADGHLYGVALLDPAIDLWGIGFPSLSKAQYAAARLLMECESCHSSEIAYLDEMEVEVFAVSRCIMRPCSRCQRTKIWNECAHAMKKPSFPIPRRRTANDRFQPRVQTRVPACIRQIGFGDEPMQTENISRGGLSFKSPVYYYAGSLIQVAVPFSPGDANIFVPARIVYARPVPSEETHQHGLMYVPVA